MSNDRDLRTFASLTPENSGSVMRVFTVPDWPMELQVCHRKKLPTFELIRRWKYWAKKLSLYIFGMPKCIVN